MSNKKANTDNKNVGLIIVIVILALILIIENFGIVFYLMFKKNDDYKFTKTTWINTYTLKNVKYKTELEFNNGYFYYKSFKNDEINFTINGTYYVDDTNIFIEHFDDDNEDSFTTYSLKYDDVIDYICFNHDYGCDEQYRYYREDDERAFKYEELKNGYEEEEKEEEKEVTPVYEKDVVPTVYVFYGQGCPHCEELFEWLKTWNYENEYQIVKYEVWYNDSNRDLMDAVSNYIDVEATGVPFIVIGNKAKIGFSKYTSPNELKAMLDEAVKNSKEGTYLDVIKTVSK